MLMPFLNRIFDFYWRVYDYTQCGALSPDPKPLVCEKRKYHLLMHRSSYMMADIYW